MVIRRTDTAKKVQKVLALVTEFSRQISRAATALQGAGGALEKIPWDSVMPGTKEHEGTILEMRKRLASEIKSGMLERKDREAEIALHAMIVWFMRLNDEERKRALGTW